MTVSGGNTDLGKDDTASQASVLQSCSGRGCCRELGSGITRDGRSEDRGCPKATIKMWPGKSGWWVVVSGASMQTRLPIKFK